MRINLIYLISINALILFASYSSEAKDDLQNDLHLEKIVSLVHNIEKVNSSCSCSDKISQDLNALESSKWQAAGFGNPNFSVIKAVDLLPDRKFQFTHEFEFSTVVFRESGWTEEQVLERMKALSSIFAKCGIRIKQINLVTVNAPNERVDLKFDNPNDLKKTSETTYLLAQKTPVVKKPIIYFIGSLTNRTLNEAGASINESWSPDKFYQNTVWISNRVKTESYKKNRIPGFLNEAHELGHILLDNNDHSFEPPYDILAGPNEKATDSFSEQHCKQIKNNQLLKPLAK